MKLINPLKDLELNKIQSPSRYIGNEYGIIKKEHTGSELYNFAIAFPDLYEIAMSNLAVKIIYNGLNQNEKIRCERVFAPDVDFENQLKEKQLPLYTLETGIPLCNLDMIGFSIGYELGITEVLAMLDLGKVPLLAKDRTESDPIVIAGGCGVTNPAPYSLFFDAIYIGDAEDNLFNLVNSLADMKKSGKSRSELLDYIKSQNYIWYKGQNKTTVRSVQSDFGLKESVHAWFPLPSSKPVQDHGVIEIMRGCPNGCRFCHAGMYYRPMRVKNLKLILNEIDHLVFDAGYREISLNSLSSADFPDVNGLLDILNERYEGLNVSFQLPSLKVNSISLDLLEKLSKIRKSGLTFAVETPEELWQLSLNKEVYAQHLEEIIKEAKNRGWSSAKFYFMIGLPVGDYFEDGNSSITEEKAIVDFLIDLQAKTRIQFNVNVGVFIPKPHTAYQWTKQISAEDAKRKIDYIYKNLPKGKFKIGKHNFDANLLEGLISRGDERASEIILNAYKKGARFDAWNEHLKENIAYWEEAFSEADWNVRDYIYKDWSLDEELPWDNVSLGTSKEFFKKEWEKSKLSELSPRCEANCSHVCGICNKKNNTRVFTKEEIESAALQTNDSSYIKPKIYPTCNIPVLYRVNFSFQRTNGSEYLAYLSQVETFHKAILRSKLPFVFTVGFNPLPRLEFATAMSLGIESLDEYATAYLFENMDSKLFIEKMNQVLPSNLKITEAQIFPVTNLRKRESLNTCLWGAKYEYILKDDFNINKYFESEQFLEFINNNPEVKFSFESSNNFDVISKDNFDDFLTNRASRIINKFYVLCPSSDKNFRKSLEEFMDLSWFEFVQIKKLKSFAKNSIQGWTANDEEMWRHNNKNFVRTEKLGDNQPILFSELFEKIAKINLELIQKKEELSEEREEFYKNHPDIKKKHYSNKK